MNLTAFTRTKQITLEYDGITRDFTLQALSAMDRESALLDAQHNHAATVKLISEAGDSLREMFLLQDQDLLAEALLNTEKEQFLRKAALTLVEDEPDYAEKLAKKAEAFQEARRHELAEFPKQKLVEKMTGLEIDRLIQVAWTCAVLDASLARALRGEGGERLFSSIEEMKEILPAEVMEKLCEAFLAFTAERGNAQVFPKPHISNV